MPPVTSFSRVLLSVSKILACHFHNNSLFPNQAPSSPYKEVAESERYRGKFQALSLEIRCRAQGSCIQLSSFYRHVRHRRS